MELNFSQLSSIWLWKVPFLSLGESVDIPLSSVSKIRLPSVAPGAIVVSCIGRPP